VQVVIALIVTPEGFPLAYEVMPGNTSDKTTLHDFLHGSNPSMARPAAPG
jgi:transposase